jgi:hypothetical protein
MDDSRIEDIYKLLTQVEVDLVDLDEYGPGLTGKQLATVHQNQIQINELHVEAMKALDDVVKQQKLLILEKETRERNALLSERILNTKGSMELRKLMAEDEAIKQRTEETGDEVPLANQILELERQKIDRKTLVESLKEKKGYLKQLQTAIRLRFEAHQLEYGKHDDGYRKKVEFEEEDQEPIVPEFRPQK